MNPYIGTEAQLYGVEEFRLIGGRGDGMRMLQVRNGKGMELTVAADRCLDITRLTNGGINMSYFSASGYVAPAYYDHEGLGFLKSFTGGFLTTCGLNAVGSPCVDDGEALPLHGTIGNTPADHVYWYEEADELVICGTVFDEVQFGRKMRLTRRIHVSLIENRFTIKDTVENTGAERQPMEILYHMNMGYPLLDQDSIVKIPASSVVGRDDHAQKDIENRLKMEKPQPGYQEECFYYQFKDGKGEASIYQPKLQKGLRITFDAAKLDGFVEWKMMGYRDYVLGLECGNCYPDGRNVMRDSGMLKFLEAGEKIAYEVNVELI